MRLPIGLLSPQQRPRGSTARDKRTSELVFLAALMEDDEEDEEALWVAYAAINTAIFSPPKPFFPQMRKSFASFDEQSCYELFRFRKDDLPRLFVALHLPHHFITNSRYRFAGEESLLILLRRLSTPNRLGDLEDIFGRRRSHICEILITISQFLLMHFHHLLETLDPRLHEYLPVFTNTVAVRAQHPSLTGVFCFVDGTTRPCCRPGGQNNIQRQVYSGHSKIHCLKFIGVSLPNGIIEFLSGPLPARRHDSYALQRGNFVNILREFLGVNGIVDSEFKALADSAVARTNVMLRMHKGNLPPALAAENSAMSSVRVSVEWTFGKVISLFSFLDYRKNLKLYLSPIGDWYKLGALLTNCHTCLYGSQTGTFFHISAPTLEWYLSVEQ
jgi:hypothetical protein